MRVAVIGWGSLIPEPRELIVAGGWRKDGPRLPVEFARLSGGGRLTLVITPEYGTEVSTYWTFSQVDVVERVRENLQVREQAKYIWSIQAVTRDGRWYGPPASDGIACSLQTWLEDHDVQVDAAVWTGLEVKWHPGQEFSLDAALAHIRRQGGNGKAAIESYIRQAPAQTETKLRQKLETELGWTRVPLGGEFFEDGIAEHPPKLPEDTGPKIQQHPDSHGST